MENFPRSVNYGKKLERLRQLSGKKDCTSPMHYIGLHVRNEVQSIAVTGG